MKKIKKYERVMPLAALELRGIHQEENKVEEGSLFAHAYKQAWKTIGQIIQDNEKVEKRSTPKQYQSFEPLIRTEVQNVIAFTGRRGTGKTSAMVSMAAALHSGGDSIPSNIPELNEENNICLADYNFYVLPCIEAGLLGSDEFFNVVISKMVMTLEEKEAQQKNMDQFMEQRISRVRQQLCDLFIVKDAKEDAYSDSKYPALLGIAEKHRTRRSFYKRVKEYLDLLKRLSTNYENYYSQERKDDKTYLVIMVDDIDVAADKSFDILQKVYQYLMIPNVIVMTTFHMDTLVDVLEKTKVEVTDFITKPAFGYGEIDDVRRRVHEFLRKIIPTDRRIVMPSWKRMDYRQLFPLEINIGENGSIQKYDNVDTMLDMTKIFPRLYHHSFLYMLSWKSKDGEQKISPKELIFCMLADRTGVYLDVRGTKKHFMEPDSLRHMYDLFRFFYYMDDFRTPKLAGNLDERNYRVSLNQKSLLDLFHFKMIPELDLKTTKEDRIFDEITAEPFERRIKKIMGYLYKPVGLMGVMERQRRLGNPSYGDMFYELYQTSRNYTRSKKLVQAILANFSFTMPVVFNEYENLRDRMDNDKTKHTLSEVEKKKRYLYSIFGSSCLGNWNNILCTGTQGQKAFAELQYETITCEVWLLFMLIPYDQFDELLSVENSEGTFTFRFPIDLSAFVMNTFLYKNFIVRIEEQFEKLGIDKSKYQDSKNEVIEVLKNYTDSASYMALPFQHTDLLYNVIKRAVADMIYPNDFELEIDTKKSQGLLSNTLFSVIRRFYRRLKDNLEDQDIFYDFYDDSKRITFSNRFAQCPVVNMFLNKSHEQEAGKIAEKFKRYNVHNADDMKIWRE